MVTINDIRSSMNRKKERKYESFELILDTCFRKIERCAHIDKLFCVFEVPEFVLGKPLYDINECILFVMSKLQNNGFKVEYIFPRLLKIDWHEHASTFHSNMSQQTAKDISLLASRPIMQKQLEYKKNPSSFDKLHQESCETNTKNVDVFPEPPKKKHSTFIKSISEFKPSGKFILNLS